MSSRTDTDLELIFLFLHFSLKTAWETVASRFYEPQNIPRPINTTSQKHAPQPEICAYLHFYQHSIASMGIGVN